MDALRTPSETSVGGLHPASDNAALWHRVLSRDPASDGVFVYGVRTTGIFCRPTCPSRRPLPRNVVFFEGAAEARRAGFRACLRCNPDAAGGAGKSVPGAIARAARHLAAHPEQHTAARELAGQTGLDRLALLRGFRRALGVTPGEFARASRVSRLREDLVAGASASITEAIYAAGFGSSSRVYEQSRSELGMTPGDLRNRAAGLVIRHAIAASPLGLMLVAATDAGVCAILFGEDPAALEADLRRRFRRAQLVRLEPRASSGAAGPGASERDQSGDWLAAAVTFVASQLTEHPIAQSFPLDIRATAFQLRVWKALQAIPRGGTRCYSDVAEAIGSPSAVRAVGAAIGANPLAVAVPCHRVVGRDGSLTGYHWGLDRKRMLLAAERGERSGTGRS